MTIKGFFILKLINSYKFVTRGARNAGITAQSKWAHKGVCKKPRERLEKHNIIVL